MPDKKDEEKTSAAGFLHAFRHKHLTWAVIAQFFYVGAQVCVVSFLILFATKAAGITESEAAYYSSAAGLAFMIGRFVGTFFMRFIAPQQLLALYAACCIILSAVTIFASGIITLYAMIGITFFMSIMFPTIFALGVKDLGVDTKPASSLIIMSIVGGAALPPLLAVIAEKTHRFQNGYWVPLLCFVVVLLFGLKGYKHSEKAVEIVQ